MFPRKLYQILCETDPAIISWDEDGTSWHIANYEEYIEGVMPLFYRHNKLTSFQRQLNLYGEKRGRERETKRRRVSGGEQNVGSRLCFRPEQGSLWRLSSPSFRRREGRRVFFLDMSFFFSRIPDEQLESRLPAGCPGVLRLLALVFLKKTHASILRLYLSVSFPAPLLRARDPMYRREKTWLPCWP